jgi:hypothetical protein
MIDCNYGKIARLDLQDWEGVLLAVFTTAFDASGHEEDQLCLVVAGFVSSDKDWAAFDGEWTARLARDGIQYFRMAEFSHSVGQFDSWKGQEERRQNLLRDLLEIISRNVYRKFGNAVVNSTFKGRLGHDVKEKFLLNAYSLAGRTCVADVSEWAKQERIKSPIQHIFEDGDKGKGKLVERMTRDGYPTPDFRRKRKSATSDGITIPAFTPLQAADFFAYELFQVIRKIEGGLPLERFRWPFQQFMAIAGETGIYTVEDLERMDMMVDVSVEAEKLAQLLKIPETPGRQ